MEWEKRDIFSSEACDMKNSSWVTFEIFGNRIVRTSWGECFEVDHVSFFVIARKPEGRYSSMHNSMIVIELLKTFDETASEMHLFGVKGVFVLKIDLSETIVELKIKLIWSVVLDGCVELLALVFKGRLLFYLLYWFLLVF